MTESTDYICHNCGADRISIFYELKNIPVHSVLLFPTQEEALNYPEGDIVLGFCHFCGFIANLAFDSKLHEYSSRYESSQGYSSTFNTFHRNLAVHLINRYDLHGKDIIEIGCGQGEFLTLLCKLGGNRGVGFDPAYISEHNESQTDDRITFIKDFYSAKYNGYHGDLVCCKMTLEHIQQTANFVNTVRRSIEYQADTIIFFQVPNVTRILRELAFWDIYYEHCSYLSQVSLAYLFLKCNFDIIDIWKDYDDQYLMIEARAGNGYDAGMLDQEENLKELTHDVTYFSNNCKQKQGVWQQYLQEINQHDRRTVIWGAGSKGVAFLTTLKIQEEIKYAVDVNPHKHGTYMAGTGQQIVAPDFLQVYKPDVVIVMNPIYYDEIRQDLNQRGVTARLIPVCCLEVADNWNFD